MQPAVFKAVPFNDAWINHEKIDIHAIYRRPILDDMGEQKIVDGVPQWDLTGGLPVRRHLDWRKKGFEYVTLADAKSLSNKLVIKGLIDAGYNPKDFIMLQNRMVGATPWNPALYLACQQQIDRGQMDKLRELVEKLGSEAVTEIKRLDNPAFELPAYLRGIAPGGHVTVPATPATAAPVITRQAAPVRLGPEVGDTRTLPCANERCGKPLPETAYGSPEAPGKAFCSEACLATALPKVAKNSLIGRQRRKDAKRGAHRVPRAAAPAASGEVPA